MRCDHQVGIDLTLLQCMDARTPSFAPNMNYSWLSLLYLVNSLFLLGLAHVYPSNQHVFTSLIPRSTVSHPPVSTVWTKHVAASPLRCFPRSHRTTHATAPVSWLHSIIKWGGKPSRHAAYYKVKCPASANLHRSLLISLFFFFFFFVCFL